MADRFAQSRARMRELAIDFPQQLGRGLAIGSSSGSRFPRRSRGAIVVGMGGSAICGDLLDRVTRAESGWGLTTIRGPTTSVTPIDRPVVLVSYSGNTWETLSAFRACRRRRVPCAVVSSGGLLVQRAERAGVPLARLPPGIPPRGAIGLLFGALIGILGTSMPGRYSVRLDAVSRRLARRQGEFASASGGPSKLAERLGDRRPTLVVTEENQAVARRWQSAVEENAKRLASVETHPEGMHNALVAWDAMNPSEARGHAAIFLRFHEESPRLAPGRAFLAKHLARRGVSTREVDLTFPDPLEAVLTGVSYGDHFSLHLAERAGVDPLETRVLDRAKRAVRAT